MRSPRSASGAHVVATALGFDPGFASFGWALADLMSDGSLHLVSLGVIRTQKDDAKREVFAAGDNFNRAKEIAAVLNSKVAESEPRVFCAESMSFPRSASVAAKMAMSWGLIAMLAEQHKIALVATSPQRIKQRVAGAKDASKQAVQDALVRQFQTLPTHLATITKSKHEHACDALASIVAGVESDVVNAIWRR